MNTSDLNKICIIAGNDPDYVFSFVDALSQSKVLIELIGSDAYEHFSFRNSVTFVNLRGSQNWRVPVFSKIKRITAFYFGSIRHVWKSDATVIHVQGFRFKFIEGILLVFLYRLFGKTVVYTAHNVQKKNETSAIDSLLFRVIYRNVNHIICHTDDIKMKIINKFGLADDRVTVIGRGLSRSIPVSGISQREAREKIGCEPAAKILLMFGRIRPDKGHDVALEALKYVDEPVVLVVAGGVGKQDKENYLTKLKNYVLSEGLQRVVQFYDYHVPDSEVEVFFKAADALILPYKKDEFQSGVLFLAYRFGLPVIASNVGSVMGEMEDGIENYIFESENPMALASEIKRFCETKDSNMTRCEKAALFAAKYSWGETVQATMDVYRRLVEQRG